MLKKIISFALTFVLIVSFPSSALEYDDYILDSEIELYTENEAITDETDEVVPGSDLSIMSIETVSDDEKQELGLNELEEEFAVECDQENAIPEIEFQQEADALMVPSGVFRPSSPASFYGLLYADLFGTSYGEQLDSAAKALYDARYQLYSNASPSKTQYGVTFQYSSSPIQFETTEEEYDSDLKAAKILFNKANQASSDAFLYDFPEVFYYRSGQFGGLWDKYTDSDGILHGYLKTVVFQPDVTFPGAVSLINEYKAGVASVVNEILNNSDYDKNGRTSNLELLLSCHNFIVERYFYDTAAITKVNNGGTDLRAWTSAGAFIDSVGNGVVCEGYARTFKVLCDQLQIPCVLCPGLANVGHLWCAVKLNNIWYQVDPTFSDTNPNSAQEPYLYFMSEKTSDRTYWNFMSEGTYSRTFTIPIVSSSRLDFCNGDFHDYTIIPAVANTCFTDGLTEGAKCEHCGDILTAQTVISASSNLHKYVAQETYVDAKNNCKKATPYTCSVCGDTYLIYSTEEYHTRKSLSQVSPTCTTSGLTAGAVCSSCGKTLVAQTILPPLGHSWNNGVQTKAATVLVQGNFQYSCITCGTTRNESIPKLKATIQVSVTSLPLQVKKTVNLKPLISGLAKGDSIKSWSTSNSKIVSVTDNGSITGKASGSASITVTLGSGKTASITIKVQKNAVATTKISNLPSKVTLNKGSSLLLSPKLAPISSFQKLSYSSSNKKVAVVSSNGKITAKAAGTAKITVKSGTKKFVVIVTVPKTLTTNIKKIPTELSIKKGKTYKLKPEAVPSNTDQKITYSTSNKKIASVSSKGIITAKGQGIAKITVKSGSVTKNITVIVP